MNEIILSNGLRDLVDANAPFWGAEAEVIRTYWDSPVRTKESDQKWLIHQIYKEYCNGVRPYLDMLYKQFHQRLDQHSRNKLEELSEIVEEEIEHYRLFADLYSKVSGQDFELELSELEWQGAWAENDDLMNLRKQHCTENESLGNRALRFTEGGYVALFAEGMKLSGRNAIDTEIAKVCKYIYDDEFSHMLLGIAETDHEKLSDVQWQTLKGFTVEQSKKRILMRNAQFSFPVSESRVEEMLNGKAEPVNFDFVYAEQLMNSRAA